MKGSEAKLLGFMEGANNRYVIPVYQRKYDWKTENCRQLYEDLKRIIRDKRESHFFGSIVSNVVPAGSKIEFHIIDGQQRLTTVTLLLLAISNLVKAGRVHSDEEDLDDQIVQRFIIAPWAKKDDKIKLCPVKEDRAALEKLFGPVDDYDRGSNMTINYQFFYDQILKEEVTVDELYTDEKNPETESRVETVLDRRGIFYEKTEVWIESERLYEVLYSFELEVKTYEQ